jgi:capsid protein
MRSGLKSWSETVRENGYNPDEVLAEMKKDQDAFKAAGLTPDWTPYFEMQMTLAKINIKNADKGTKKEQE